jgi:hypothetical protein
MRKSLLSLVAASSVAIAAVTTSTTAEARTKYKPRVTKQTILDGFGHCNFFGGMCTDSGGRVWDCSNPNACVRVDLQ